MGEGLFLPSETETPTQLAFPVSYAPIIWNSLEILKSGSHS